MHSLYCAEERRRGGGELFIAYVIFLLLYYVYFISKDFSGSWWWTNKPVGASFVPCTQTEYCGLKRLTPAASEHCDLARRAKNMLCKVRNLKCWKNNILICVLSKHCCHGVSEELSDLCVFECVWLWGNMNYKDGNTWTCSFLNVKTMHVMDKASLTKKNIYIFTTYSPLNPETLHGSLMYLETSITSVQLERTECVCVCSLLVRHCQAKMLYHSSVLQLFKMREESPAPRLQVWNPILDPNAALVEPWCQPSTLRPGGLVFKWILLTSLIRDWKSQLNSMWWNSKETKWLL